MPMPSPRRFPPSWSRIVICAACGALVDTNDDGQVVEHQGPLPHTPQTATILPVFAIFEHAAVAQARGAYAIKASKTVSQLQNL
jgi:hypothetical protein